MEIAIKHVVHTRVVQHIDGRSRIWTEPLYPSFVMTWNRHNIIPLIRMLTKIRNKMLAIRLYISALTILFLVLVIANRGLGILEGIVITCAIVYLIIDARSDLQLFKRELHLLKVLEKHISVYLR